MIKMPNTRKDLKSKKILVTGGLGFIGSNFAEYLVNSGYNVVIYDAKTYAGNMKNVEGIRKKVKLLVKDIGDFKELCDAISEVDVIYHLAAESHVHESILSPRKFMETNFMGTYNVLEACRKHDKKMVYVSTSEVYGTALKIPMTEEHPLNPRSPYAGSKAGADRLCYSYYITYGLPVSIARPFNNYGPKQLPEKVIPNFIIRAFFNKPLEIHGGGLQTRDWLYVSDHCDALEKFLHFRTDGETLNLGTGRDISILYIANLILKHLNKSPSLIKHVGDRPGQVKKHIACTKKAEKLLKWKAKTSFEIGLKKTIDWYLQNKRWWGGQK